MRGRQRVGAWLAWALGGSVIVLGLVGVGLGGAADAGVQAVLDVVGLVVVGLVGALIAARLPTNPYGWLWLAVGLCFGGQSVALASRDATPPADAWLIEVVEGLLFGTVMVLLVLVLVLFPTGRLPGRAWRWLPRAAVVVVVGWVGATLLAPPDGGATGPWVVRGTLGTVLVAIEAVGVFFLLFLILAAALSVLLRFRRAGPLERQQLKWFGLAAGMNVVVIVLEVSGVAFPGAIWSAIDTVALTMVPVAVGIAVLRYRLYEIDRIISRSVSYGLLTGGLVALYLVLVALLRSLLQPVTGSSALAVTGSTLAVAAVFNPARRRLQALVDRRFDRARYDAARSVDAFAARLRNQVDLDEVTAGLRQTVADTVAPTRIAVWLRPAERG